MLISGTSVCAGTTILDGIVLAKSAFNTSMNYRSVMIFGSMVDVKDYDRKYAISEALAEGDKVQLIGFGTFETRKRKARSGRNPQTGEVIEIPESMVPAFKPGNKLKDATK